MRGFILRLIGAYVLAAAVTTLGGQPLDAQMLRLSEPAGQQVAASETSTLGILLSAGYTTPQNGIVLSGGLLLGIPAGDQLIVVAPAMDVIMADAADYTSDSSGVCRDNEDDRVVEYSFCTATSLAYRGEVLFRLGRHKALLGPGLRIPGEGTTGNIEPYGALYLGGPFFLIGKVGAGFRQIELGYGIRPL